MEKRLQAIILLASVMAICRGQTPISNSSVLNQSNVNQSGPVSKQLDVSPSGTNYLRTILAQLVASRRCEKGMMAFLNQSLPYPLTYPVPKKTFDFPFPCDTTTDGGGWIVIQRRASGDVDFNRTWEEYKNGFGSFAGDFWLGNDNIHTITKSGTYELRVDVVFNGTSAFAHYDSFSIESEHYTKTIEIEYNDRYGNRRTKTETEPYGYKMSLGAYDGTAGDSFRDNDGRPFSTRGVDRDSSGGNCAEEYNGGWWFVGCGYSCLNGQWGADSTRGMEWRDLTGGLSVSFSEMKVRRLS